MGGHLRGEWQVKLAGHEDSGWVGDGPRAKWPAEDEVVDIVIFDGGAMLVVLGESGSTAVGCKPCG